MYEDRLNSALVTHTDTQTHTHTHTQAHLITHCISMEKADPTSASLHGSWGEHLLLQYAKKEGFIKP